MNADNLKRATGSALSGLLALGLAFGLNTGLDAQERTQERQDRQQDRQEQEISEDEIEDALENADDELQSLEEHPNLQSQNIRVVRLEDVLDDQEKVSELQSDHQEGIQKFRTQLRGNRSLSQALQQQNLSAEDVLAVKVKDAEEMDEDRPDQPGEERTEMAADQPTVFVVVSGTGAARQGDQPGREEMAREDTERERDRTDREDTETERERDRPDRDPTEKPPEDWPEDRPDAQEPDYEDREQQQQTDRRQQGQMSDAHIEEALAEPGLQLYLLESRDVQSQNVEVVRVEEITDRQKASTMRRDHQHSVQRFQQAIRDNENLSQALEEQNVSVDDVLAVRATDTSAGQAGGQEGERQEMAADQSTVQVFVFGGAAARQDARDRDRPGQEQDRDWQEDRADRQDREQQEREADRQDTPRQDRPERQQRQQQMDRQDQELSEQQVEEALSRPEQQLQSLERHRDLQAENVEVVKLEDIFDDQQKASEMRQQNQQGARQFQSELRGNRTLMQALEQENVDVEDVLAVHVKEGSDDPRQQREGERTEMAAGQPTVYVIVSDSGMQQDTEDEDAGYPRG